MGDHDEDGHDALAARIIERATAGLVVGARVRVVNAPECLLCAALRFKGAACFDGLTGRIEYDRWPLKTFQEFGHSYLVRLDEPYADPSAPNGYWLLGHYAAGELVLLTPGTAADGPDAGEG